MANLIPHIGVRLCLHSKYLTLSPSAKNPKPGSRRAGPVSLDGLTLGLIWNAKRGGDVALVKAGELISDKYQNVKVNRYDSTRPCEKKLLARAMQECDVFIVSTGD